MSSSPFRTTTGPFVEVPVPVAPASLSDAKKALEDVPFDADIHEFPAMEKPQKKASYTPVKPISSWRLFLNRLFSGKAERRLREEMLSAELQDLRASYAGLLHSTEDIRERMELEKENTRTVAKALSPFPAAVAGIEKLHTRQEEATEVLSSIRHRLDTTSDREESLLSSMDSIHGGFGKLQAEVGSIHSGVSQTAEGISEIAANQLTASVSLGDFGEKMETRFEEAAELAHKNSKRIEQSNDDVLLVLRQMERNSQRGLWIFASLLAILFVTLICFSAKMSQLGVSQAVAPSSMVEEPVSSEDSYVSSEPAAQVLVDELEF